MSLDIDRWRAHYDAMTLGEATEWRRGPAFACACAGPIIVPAWTGMPCSCRATAMQAAALHRAGHIAVRLARSLATVRALNGET